MGNKNLLLRGVIKSIILCLALASCNVNEESLNCSTNKWDNHEMVNVLDQDMFETKNTSLYNVTIDDAKNLAASFSSKKEYKIEPYVIGKDTLLYLVNFEEGWALIAGDKRINPIVAISDEGGLSFDTSNENLKTWIDSYADEIRVLKKHESETENEYTKFWSKFSPSKNAKKEQTRSQEYKWAVISNTRCDYVIYTQLVSPLIQTKWGHNEPWNFKLPFDTSKNKRCPTGCTAVALAQIIYHMHYNLGKPTGLYHNITVGVSTISSETDNIGLNKSNFVSNSSRWDNMALISGDSGNISYVGDLMLCLGSLLNMSYSGTGGTAQISHVAMSEYNINYSQSSYDYQTVKDNLLNNKPVNVTASYYDTQENQRVGHSWIIDGYGTVRYHYVIEKHFEYTENWMHEQEYCNTFDDLRMRYHINSEFDTVEEDGGFHTSEYLRMNWGYDGVHDNAYYSTYPSIPWEIDGNEYIYNKTINYDFR